MRSASACEAALLQPPHEHVKAVLAKEGFILEDHGGHSPMSGGPQLSIVLRQLGIEAFMMGVHRGLKVRKSEPGSTRGFRDVVASVPAVYFTAPQQLGYLPAEFDPAPAFRRCDTKAA